MTVHSGRFGLVNGQKGVRTWSINDTSAPAKFVASNTKRGTGRRKGIRSWTGSFGCYGVVPLVMPGESFAFKGYTSPEDDQSGDGICYEGTALVDSVALTWNWQTAEILSHVVNFSGHLALTPTMEEYTDATSPDYGPTGLCKLTCAAPAGQHVDWEDLVSATLTISNPSVSYVNSSTGGLTGRHPGPAVDWTLALVEQNTTRQGLGGSTAFDPPEIDDELELKLYDSLATFWQLHWGIVREYTGITADRETGAIIQRTCNIDMLGFNLAGTAGTIKLPGAGQAWWPA